MEKIFILIFYLITTTIDCYAEYKADPQIELDLQEGQRFTNSVAVGITFSAMSKCIGENPDSEIAKVAGSVLVSTAIAEFHKAKLDQKDPYKYSFDQTGLVNDAQKLSITGEQIVNNTNYLKVLKDKRFSEESIKRQLEVAESVAHRELIAMQAAKAECHAGIYYGAYQPFWNAKKERYTYGKCAWDWGDNNERAVGCAKFKAEEISYRAAHEGKVSSELKQKRADCDRAAINAANSTRIFSIKSADDCAEKCDDAARICFKCKIAMRAAKELGLPAIEQLLSDIEPSSINSAKILKAHHNTIVKMYKTCGRDDVLNELKKIKSVSTKVDPQFEKLRGDSADIYNKYGGLATTGSNKYLTDKNRSADDVHNVEMGEEPSKEQISEFSLTKENLFSEIPVDATLPTEGQPLCGDWAAKGCGEYSKLLMKSLNSCSETLNSTVYQQMLKQVINYYAAILPEGKNKIHDEQLTSFKYFAQQGVDLLFPNAHAKTMTSTVGGAIGLGGNWLEILNKNQKNLIKVFDPLLSTYNKRILAYQIARDLINLSLTNTKKSIQNVETRLVELNKIKSTLDTTAAITPLPIISAKVTKDQEHKWDPEVKAFLDMVCNQADCSHITKSFSSNLSTSNNTSKNLNDINHNILKASNLITTMGDTLFRDKKLTQEVQDNMNNLSNMDDQISSGLIALQTETNHTQSQFTDLKNNLLNVSLITSNLGPLAPANIIKEGEAKNGDYSVYYKNIKAPANNPITVQATETNKADNDSDVEYEAFTDRNISLQQNDLVNNIEGVRLWDIISTRYIKIQERLDLIDQ